MNKIPPKILKYFKYAVEFKCKITPPPKTSTELNFIIQNFEKLSAIDYLTNTSLNDVSIIENQGFWMKIVFNPVFNRSKVAPVFSDDDKINDDKSELKSKHIQAKLIENLDNLIAIPRYLYLKNDNSGFLSNRTHLKFNYDLSTKGSMYHNKFELSNASNNSAFIYVTKCDPPIDKYKLRASIRHNFSHFHKIDNIEIKTNPYLIVKNLQEPL
ncbi:hypothetical protein KGF54_003901 [Candida jiufengensis]|uniref:uncharacterized protein n=1 Tax=Candida jiufengensis TaxID=497108 RepID=UPI00222501CF|nr:uncharacterized protein KGF54_003901 [Candida jiufengensis]KAI5950827.1 hypothetical protein KGF54_003901 [Candida jiufengensis]